MVVNSLLPDISIPNINLVDYLLTQSHQRHPQDADTHRVFVDAITDESLTLDEFSQMARQLGRGLQHHFGVKPMDVVAIVSNNSIQFPVAVYAILLMSAICSPTNPTYTAHEMAHQLKDSGCKMVMVGDAGIQKTVQEAIELAGISDQVQDIVRLDASNIRTLLINDQEPAVPTEIDVFSHPAYLCYSSGTTGKPKGVLLTHANMLANTLQINQVKTKDHSMHDTDIYLGLAPFCHVYGLSYVLHSSVALGGTIIIMPTYSFDLMLDTIQKFRITYGYLVPPIICALSKDPRVQQYNLTSMRTVLSGGATLSPSLIKNTEQRLPQLRVIQGYGMTEMSPAVTMLSTSHTNHSSIGILLPSCRAKVLDHDGREIDPHNDGELCFKGPNIMPGYLNNPEATQRTIDAEGFLHTGDIGHVDEDGFFYITDRKKELIKFKGFQVSPSELEGLLAEHPDIEDAAVMAVYDDTQATEMPKGYFVLKRLPVAGTQTDALARGQTIANWLHQRVARYKRLRGGFTIIDHIPRSPAGKIIRNSLRNIEHIS